MKHILTAFIAFIFAGSAYAQLSPRINNLETNVGSLQNTIINGDVFLWQRGTSATATVGATYLADRFALSKDTTPNNPVYSQSSDVPTFAQSGYQSTYSLLITGNASASTPTSSDGMVVRYDVEGLDYTALHGKPVRLQFWVKSSVAGTYGITLANKNPAANQRVYATTYTINSPATWEKKTIDVTLDSTAVWNFDNTVGLSIRWGLSCGAGTTEGTLNTWVTDANPIECASGQVNWTNNVSPTFLLSQVALYQGSFASTQVVPFKRAGKDWQQELAMAQRYFEWMGVSTFMVIDTTQLNRVFCVNGCVFKVSKRITPTMNSVTTIYATDYTANAINPYNSGTPKLTVSSVTFDTTGLTYYVGLGSSATANTAYLGIIKADAEL